MPSTKREKELARQRAERQSARRTAAATRRKQRNAVLASVAAVVLVVAAAVGVGLAVTGGDDDTAVAAPPASESAAPEVSEEPASPTPSEAPSTEPSASPAAGTCTYEPTEDPAAKEAPVPPMTDVEDELVLTATLATSQGEIVFEMDSAAAPCTVNSLRTLAGVGYFDDTPCHRLTSQGISVLQCGDPTGTGSGGPGYEFADENLEGATYPRGTVAMANAGPGTNGSQFFLVYADTQLPPAYTPFGTITSGLELLEEVADAGSDGSNGAGDGAPNLPVQIQTLRVAGPAA